MKFWGKKMINFGKVVENFKKFGSEFCEQYMKIFKKFWKKFFEIVVAALGICVNPFLFF